MTNKLYVANVPLDTTEDALRRHFAACGGVSEVEILTDHRGANPRGLARVTMTSPAYAAAAINRLDGAPFDGKSLRVSDVPIRAEKAPGPTVKVVQQFRERGNMTYDLDCSGLPLTLRIFPLEGDHWRVEARSTDAADAVVVHGSGATRRDALGAAVRDWNDRAAATCARALDGDGLLKAMRDIRAV